MMKYVLLLSICFLSACSSDTDPDTGNTGKTLYTKTIVLNALEEVVNVKMYKAGVLYENHLLNPGESFFIMKTGSAYFLPLIDFDSARISTFEKTKLDTNARLFEGDAPMFDYLTNKASSIFRSANYFKEVDTDYYTTFYTYSINGKDTLVMQ